jgi:hypothetical protein
MSALKGSEAQQIIAYTSRLEGQDKVALIGEALVLQGWGRRLLLLRLLLRLLLLLLGLVLLVVVVLVVVVMVEVIVAACGVSV